MKPKFKRRAARRRRQAERAREAKHAVYVHVNLTGDARNPIGKVSSLDRVICVGFGGAAVYRDGEMFVDGEQPERRSVLNQEGFVTLRKIEHWIKKQRAGHHRWTARMDAPLWSAKWERQRPGKWVCVEAGEGFA